MLGTNVCGRACQCPRRKCSHCCTKFETHNLKCLCFFTVSNTFHAEVLPSFGFDASAVQLPAVPQLNPVRDTAASRLASTLDNRASDDSGILSNRSCHLSLLLLEDNAVPISPCDPESSRSRRKRAKKSEKRRGSSHRSSTHDTQPTASHRSGAAASHRSGAAGASLNELLGSNVPTDSHPMCVCAQTSNCSFIFYFL